MVRDRRGRCQGACQGRGTWRKGKGDGAWRHPPRLGRRRREARGQGDAAGWTRRGGLGRPVPPWEISRGRSVGDGRGRRAGTERLGRTPGGEDLAHGDRVLDRGDHAQPPATAGARQHVDREGSSFILHLLHGRCPQHRARTCSEIEERSRTPRVTTKVTRCAGVKMGTKTTKGLAELSANPLSPRWLRGLDLNQRPLGYECVKAMSGNPLISREMHALAGSSTLCVRASFLLPFRPVSGCYGSKMGAAIRQVKNRVSQTKCEPRLAPATY